VAKYSTIILFVFLSTTALGSPGKILYHLHNTDNNSYRRAISNLENLYKGMPGQQLDIKILFQGDSIKLLNFSENDSRLNQRFMTLINKGVSIELSKANFKKNQLIFERMDPPKLVPNIYSRIIELQKQGYNYITP